MDALELTTHNLEILNSKADGIDNIRTHQGTALDLSGFADETFDLWLKYHFATCERQDLIGATNHSLDILIRQE